MYIPLPHFNQIWHKNETEAKIKANNDAYDQLMAMCLVGQEAFENDESKRHMFIFSDLLLKVAGAGTSGLHGLVLFADNGQAFAGVNVHVQYTDINIVTDNAGRFTVLRVAAGTYKVVFSAEGYKSVTVEVVIEAGVVTRMQAVLMEAEPAPPAAVAIPDAEP